MSFSKYYKFPLQLDIFSDKVMTSDDTMAFDFADVIYGEGEEIYEISNHSQDALVKALNNNLLLYHIPDADDIVLDNADIYIIQNNRRKLFIILRGWGNLTGIGGHRLPDVKAKEIQKEFGEFIISKIRCKNKEN